MLLLVLGLQSMALMPARQHAVRHHHVAVSPGQPVLQSAMSRLAAWTSGWHFHDGVMHHHDHHHDFDGEDHEVRVLGQQDDAGQQPLLAGAGPWPRGDAGLWVLSGEGIAVAGCAAFTSHCVPVPFRPPRA